jgi:hemerythrin-like domain-containing protein
MALLHNSILRGYNSIYNQILLIQEADKADLVGYCLTWYKFVKSHHDDEEENLFTRIEDLLQDKTVFAETHKEHGMYDQRPDPRNPLKPRSLRAHLRERAAKSCHR